MSLLNKVKNFFYEEVEEDDDEILRKEEEKRRAKELKREEKRKAELEKLAKEAARREEKMAEAREKEEREKQKEIVRSVEPKKEDLSERELFKSERTFNFPMDLGDDIFDDEDKTQTIVVEKKEEPKAYARPTTTNSRYVDISRTTSYTNEPPKDEGPHRFKPSPVISPVYGILDKNYTVEDVKEKGLSKTKEFSLEKKIVDFDSVRNKAYKELDEEIEKTLTNSKDIFYNIDEEKEELPVEDYEEDPYVGEENNVVITYDNEVDMEDEEPVIEEQVEETEEPSIEPEEENDSEEEEEEEFTPDVAITRVEKKAKRTRRSKKEEVEEAPTKDDEKEDLFNLIDNMYNDDDEEEDE